MGRAGMDVDDEVKRFKQIMAAGFLFLISMYLSYQEFKYFIWSEVTIGQVARVFETKSSRRSPRKWAVEYAYVDNKGEHHRERDDIPISWPSPQEQVDIQYLPGVHNSSRIRGNTHQFAVWMFGGSLAYLGYALYQLIREANEPIARTARPPYRRGPK